jgi:hypothetical protein
MEALWENSAKVAHFGQLSAESSRKNDAAFLQCCINIAGTLEV